LSERRGRDLLTRGKGRNGWGKAKGNRNTGEGNCEVCLLTSQEENGSREGEEEGVEKAEAGMRRACVRARGGGGGGSCGGLF